MAETPKRPRTHALETKSKRLFDSMLPDEWVVTEPGDDYGVDRLVEIFKDGTTTGLQFNVQLKATDADGAAKTRWSIKRQTLNYWETLATPTLIVIAHAPTETLRYQWSHLAPQNAKNTKSVSIAAERLLDNSVALELSDEVEAFHLARELWRHLPIPIVLEGTALNGQDVRPIKREIRRFVRKIPSLAVVADSGEQIPRATVVFRDERVDVAISGTLPRPLSWSIIDVEMDRTHLAADILAAVGVGAGTLGAANLAAALLKIAAPFSGMLAETAALPDVVRLLAQSGGAESILTLIRRTACVENHPSGFNVLIAVMLALQSDEHEEIRAAVGWSLRDAARTWRRPARSLYNAAGLLAPVDSSEAIKLYEAAASADETYLARGYWWWEKGRAHWKAHDVINAEACYRKALSLGEGRAVGPLSDVLFRTGRFKEAMKCISSGDIWTEPDQAQWRLTLLTLQYLVEELGIADQDPSSWSSVGFEPLPGTDLHERARAFLQENAIDGWAHAAIATSDPGDLRTSASIAAAICLPSNPSFWLRVVEDAMTDKSLTDKERAGIAQDALHCAWVYHGDEFKEALEDDPLVPEQLKGSLLSAFDATRPGEPAPEIRIWDDDTGQQLFGAPAFPGGPEA